MNVTRIMDTAAAFAGFVIRMMSIEAKPIFAITDTDLAMMSSLTVQAGFEVERPTVVTREEFERRRSSFPMSAHLAISFRAPDEETGLSASGWLDLAFAAANEAASAGQAAAIDAVMRVLRMVEPIDPIVLTSVHDRLVVESHHSVERFPMGFNYRPKFPREDDPLAHPYVGRHEHCEAVIRMRKGAPGFGRLVCANSCFAILVGSEAAKTYGGLRQDLQSRILGSASVNGA